MAFASGQTVTAAMLNRIESKKLNAVVSADQNATTSDVDLNGATLNVTTPQANTVLEIFAALDVGTSGASDFPFVKLSINGVLQTQTLKFQGITRAGIGKLWVVNVSAASSFTVKLVLTKIGAANTCSVYGTHSSLSVVGNGIS